MSYYGHSVHGEDADFRAPIPGVDYEPSEPANPDWVNPDGSVNHEAIAAEWTDDDEYERRVDK